MQPSEIQKIIEAEIAGNWDRWNPHGVKLRTCLVTPEKKTYGLHGGGTQELWLVLEENPETHFGYRIVFDEQTGKFGLAMDQMSDPVDFYLGPYGSFLTTLDAM